MQRAVFHYGLGVVLILGLVSQVPAHPERIYLPDDGLPCDSEVFCHGPLLEAVHLAEPRIFNDSKDFVDFPLKVNASFVLAEFAKLQAQGNVSRAVLVDFIEQYFDNREADLPTYTPPDWKDTNAGGLPLYHNITDPGLREFAKALHGRWRELGRNISQDVKDKPDQHSLIYVPHPFIVPGGRFDEIYYWDSFWVVQGLLVSNMPDTVRSMIRNMAYLIYQYGHMPNGNRVYYTKRSQPPLLALMVDQYRKHPNVNPADAMELVKELLPALEIEHEFWMNYRNVTVVRNGIEYKLNVYRGGIRSPRPESYREDYETAHKRAQATGDLDNATVFANIAAGAESGWDFSTRWLDTTESEFYTIRTESIVPVDLNAFLYTEESLMAEFYALTGNSTQAERYRGLELDRGDAIQAVLWNAEKNMWRDFDLKLNRSRDLFHLSDVTPVFARCNGRNNNVTDSAFLKRLLDTPDMKTLTSYPGGFPMSTRNSSTGCCQWDFPNAWPGQQLTLIEGFAADPELHDIVKGWAQKWVTAVYTGFSKTGNLYEKYNALEVGAYGTGGEYEVQLGFGWTNGGILRLLEMYPTELTSPADPTPSPSPTAPTTPPPLPATTSGFPPARSVSPVMLSVIGLVMLFLR